MDNDKIIAKFYGVEPDENGFYDGWELQKAGLPFMTGIMGNGLRDIPFNKSWDWLMPVVEKIEKVYDGIVTVEIEGNNCRIVIKGATMHDPLYFNLYSTLGSKLESTYESVIDFAKWYNNLK